MDLAQGKHIKMCTNDVYLGWWRPRDWQLNQMLIDHWLCRRFTDPTNEASHGFLLDCLPVLPHSTCLYSLILPIPRVRENVNYTALFTNYNVNYTDPDTGPLFYPSELWKAQLQSWIMSKKNIMSSLIPNFSHAKFELVWSCFKKKEWSGEEPVSFPQQSATHSLLPQSVA